MMAIIARLRPAHWPIAKTDRCRRLHPGAVLASCAPRSVRRPERL